MPGMCRRDLHPVDLLPVAREPAPARTPSPERSRLPRFAPFTTWIVSEENSAVDENRRILRNVACLPDQRLVAPPEARPKIAAIRRLAG